LTKKGKQIPVQGLTGTEVPEGWGSHISRYSAHEDDKVVSHTNRPPLPQGIFLAVISVTGWVDPRDIVL